MIIGLGYRARAGKDEVARHLVAHHGFTRVAFADKLKTAARVIFNLTDEQVNGSDKEVLDPRWGLTPRAILQKLGTESVRDVFGGHVWRKSLFMDLDPGKNYVITDVRFPDEATEVRDHGGWAVEVRRPGLPAISTTGHASESALDGYKGWDGTLFNDQSLESLYVQTDVLLAWLQREDRLYGQIAP